MALVKGFTPKFYGEVRRFNYRFPVAADQVIYEGATAVIDSATGYAVVPSVATGLVTKGWAAQGQNVDSTGFADGEKTILIEYGVVLRKNDATDPVTNGDKICYIFDDETVSSNATGTSIAGGVLFVDENNMVAVNMMPQGV